MLSQVQVYLKQNAEDAAMTIEHMRHLFRSGSPQAQQLTQRMCRYGANITGSRPYWYAKQQELQETLPPRAAPLSSSRSLPPTPTGTASST